MNDAIRVDGLQQLQDAIAKVDPGDRIELTSSIVLPAGYELDLRGATIQAGAGIDLSCSAG